MPAYHFDSSLEQFVKKCPKCATIYQGGETTKDAEKQLSKYFAQDRYTTDGFYGTCRPCVSKYMRGKRDGRICDPDKMLEDQNGKCGICEKSLEFRPGGYCKITAYVDHDHDTNKVRGILCARCNSQLSIVDNPVWLKQALNYLKKYGKEIL